MKITCLSNPLNAKGRCRTEWANVMHIYIFSIIDTHWLMNLFLCFRDSMSDEEKEQFWRNVQCTVEKDVIRTDRSHPYFRGENNPNIEVLK